MLADSYTLSSLARILAWGVLAVSVAVLTLYAGLPTLGQVAPYAVGGYTTAILARAGHDAAPLLLSAAAVAAAVFSLAVGAAVARTRGVVFLMITLAVGVLAATAAGQWRGLTGGTDGLGGIPPTRPWWGAPPLTSDQSVYLYVLVVAGLVLAATVWMVRSPAGMMLRGCRDHEARMRACGHPVTGYLLAAYVCSGTIAGVGGSLLVTAERYISPHDVGFEVAALVLLAVVIGGSVGGAMAAVGLVVAIRETTGAHIPGHTPLLLGLLFLATVYTPWLWSLASRRSGPLARLTSLFARRGAS
jgi:branched-chain amino acid transport system permease protein